MYNNLIISLFISPLIMRGISIGSAKKVCKFWDGEGYIRVSTDHMPEDGEETLDTLFELVKSYAYDDSEE